MVLGLVVDTRVLGCMGMGMGMDMVPGYGQGRGPVGIEGYRSPKTPVPKVRPKLFGSQVLVGSSGTTVRSGVFSSEILIGTSGSEVWLGTPES